MQAPGHAAEQLPQADRDVALLRQMARHCAELSDLAGELLIRRTVSAAPLRDFARRLVYEVRAARGPHDLWPGDGINVRQWLIEHSGVPHALAFADGLLSARPLIRAAAQHYGWSRRIELLTLAALLQNVGLMQLGRGNARRSVQPSEFENCHPTVSAALVAGLTEFDLELPRLIAAHHERIDGSGRPARLWSRQLPEVARLLIVAVRFAELRYGSASDQSHGGAPVLPIVAAASSLCREALRGEHDLAVTTRFLQALGIDVPHEIEPTHRLDAPAPSFEFDGGGRSRCDGAHETAPPHHVHTAQTRTARQDSFATLQHRWLD